MAITKRDPNTIYLGGGGTGPGGQDGYTLVNDMVAYSAITPGMLVETMSDSGVPKWRPHSTATGTFAQKAIALEQDEWNLGVDDAYAAADLVKVAILRPGSTVWAIVPSGQNIVPGDFLASDGNGKLRESQTGSVARALESTGGAVTADTRVRVEIL